MEDWNWKTIIYAHYRSIFNHCDIIGLQSYRIRWKKRKIRAITPLGAQGQRTMFILGSLESAMDFLLVLIELFSLGVTAEALWVNIGSKSAISLQRGPVDQKFQVEGVTPTNYSSSQKTRVNHLSYGIKISTDLSSVLSQCTRLTDGQTDGQTDEQNSHR